MKRNSLPTVVLALLACIAQPAPLLCQSDSAKQAPRDGTVLPNGPGGITPPRAIDPRCPTYDDASRKAKVEGTVRLKIIVMPDGQVKDPKVVNSVSEALDKKSIDAVLQWKFDPATKDGKPVATQIDVVCNFKLK
jgi:periplasmic protein TonB